MSEPVRLLCPLGRKYGELWGGAALAAVGIAVLASAWDHWAGLVLGILLAAAGVALAGHGATLHAPVIEVDADEFVYARGRYHVTVPRDRIGSYAMLTGRTRSLALYDPAGRPLKFPSTEGRRASRPYLSLTGLTSPDKVEMFMGGAGIPPRDRSLTAGS
ncbi:hypothetical protein [Nocardiopsis coralliicola]